MYPEIAAILICTAAGSYCTYGLVVRHFTSYFDLVLQRIEEGEKFTKKAAGAIVVGVREDINKLRDSHISVLEATVKNQVKNEVKNTLSVAAVETCSICKKLVARFENLEGVLKCHNCIKAGK